MEISYRQALDQLQSMFQDTDLDTIKSVLAANEGHVERTIEDLLKMAAEAEGDGNNDNLFADAGSRPKNRPNKNDDLFAVDDDQHNNNQYGGYANSGSDARAREMQEKADAELAYRLQKQEIAAEKELERQTSASGKSRAGVNAGPQHSNQYPQNQGQPQGQGSGEKKKTGLMSKVKTGISNIFGKKGKGKGPTQNPGQYAEIDNLDEQEVYNFSNGAPLQGASGHKDDEYYEDAPMQLSDILGGSKKNYQNQDDDEENNDRGNNRYRNNAGVNNDHFDFS